MKLIISLMFSSVLFAQCKTAGPYTTCASLCNISSCASPTQSLQSFLTNNNTSLVGLNKEAATYPQPKIIMTLQNIPLNGSYIGTGGCGTSSCSQASINMMTAAVAKGITVFYNNLWPLIATADPTYAANASGHTVVTADCGTFAYGIAPIGTCGPMGQALYQTDLAMGAAGGIGITDMRIVLFPNANTLVGTTPTGCNYGAGSVTVTNYTDCLGPLIKTILNRYNLVVPNGIKHVQVITEPTGGIKTFTGVTFTVANIGSIITSLCTTVHGVLSSASCEATGLNSDSAYFTDWVTNHTAYGLGNLAMDVFQASCTNTSSSYKSTIDAFFFCKTCNSGAAAWAQLAVAAGIKVDVTQADMPEWCLTSGASGLGTMYIGSLDVIWSDTITGFQSIWNETLQKVASASGVSSMTIFGDLQFFYQTSDQNNDNLSPNVGNGAALAMSNISTQGGLINWGILNRGWQGSVQGNGAFSGNGKVGQ